MGGKKPLPVEAPPRGYTVWSEAVEKAILESLCRGASLTAACAAARVGRQTCYAHMTQDEKFRAQVEMARESVIGVVEQAAVASAVVPDAGGRRDVQAMKLVLYNRARDRYAERAEITGDLTVNEGRKRIPLSSDDRRKLQEIAHKRILEEARSTPGELPY